jgi:hypothetical protein
MRLSEYTYYTHCSNNDGYCSHCNSITKEGGVEPDAKNYSCPDCNNPTLMGIEMAFIQDCIGVVEDEYEDESFQKEMDELQLSLDDEYTEHDDEYGV